MSRCFIITKVVFGLLIFAGLSTELRGEGGEITLRTDDLIVNVDYRWAGNSHGGYYPLRIRIVNQGEERDLAILYDSENPEVPQVRRRLLLEENASISTTLEIPMVSQVSAGHLSISTEGSVIEGLECDLGFGSPNTTGSERPALIIISDVQLPADQFEYGSSLTASDTVTSSSRRFGTSRKSDHEVLAPGELPDSWIGYSGVDLVAVDIETFGQMTQQERRAVIKWMECGGTLIVFNLGSELSRNEQAEKLLNLPERKALGEIQDSNASRRENLRPIHLQLARAVNAQQSSVPRGRTFSTIPSPAEQPGGILQVNDADKFTGKPAFQLMPVMFGRVVFMDGNPFPGTSLDWYWLLSDVGTDNIRWINRQGMSARHPHSQFIEFLIPGVRGVPIFSFMALITLFTILIGPVNYLLLWKRKQLFLLVLTIPIVALVTSVGMFGYSFLAHGFSVKSRVRAVTILDQGSQDAVTMSRVAMHAGLAPSSGLQFDRDTAVFPIWPTDGGFDGGIVDWTEQQSLASGWLRSRTRTQFLTIANEAMRGRIELREDADGTVVASNGLEWDLKHLMVRHSDGTIRYLETLAAGEELPMAVAETSDLVAFGRDVAEFDPETPAGYDASKRSIVTRSSFGRRRRSRLIDPSFADGLLEKAFSEIKDISTRDNEVLPEGTYIALVDGMTVAPMGVDDTVNEASVHVVLGRF